MKLRKLLIIAFTFIFVSLFAVSFKVSANTVETSELITVQGAQIRTTGNAGIRFVAKEEYEGANETAYGIILAYGEAEANEQFVIGGTVNGKEVLKGEVVSTRDGIYTVTLYNVPEEAYTQVVTARAYVVDGDKVIYSKEVATRSLAQVAIAAYEEGDQSEFVANIYNEVNKSTLHYVDEPLYASFDAFVSDLLNDFKNNGSSSITAATFASSTGTSVKNVFAKAELLTKYRWLVEFALLDLEANWIASNQTDYITGTYSESKEMFTRMLNGDVTAISGSYANGRTYFRQFIHTLINKATKGHENYSAYDGYISDFSVESNYMNILPIYTASEKKLLAENEVLPTNLIKNYYTFAGWYDNDTFEGEAITEHNGSKNYYAKFTPTVYTITYHLQDGTTTAELVEQYTVTTPTFALPTASEMSIENGEFAGWYTNAAGTGTAVTEITLGTAGNISLYACWQMDQATVVELTAADEAVLAKYTPTIYVLETASAGKYEINGQEYKFGETLFATLADALSAASADAVIYVFAGDYTLATQVTESVTILGPNADALATAERANEAVITVTVGTVTLTGANVKFNGLKVMGSSSATSAGIYFQSGEGLATSTFQSCVLTKGNTFMKYTAGSGITINVLDCNISNIGQFFVWTTGSVLSELNMKGCYFDASQSGGVSNTAGAMVRLLSGNAHIYNNTFVGDLPSTSGGYFCNRGTGTFEVKYNTFKDVTKFICTSSATTHAFDCNLYLTGETAAVSSPVSGTGVTADTTVASSAQDLASKWDAFNNAQ